MPSTPPSQCLLAEPDSDFLQINESEQASLQNYLRERLLEIRTRNYSNTGIADAKAIQKISSEFEILVFGPARVGKSTLIRELSGDEQIRTSPGLNACTQTTTAYTDQFGVRWWDTRGKNIFSKVVDFLFFLLGIEQWTEAEARSFLTEKFLDRHIIPRAAIFCRTAGALANTPVLQLLFRQFESHGIALFYVITRWPFLPRREQIAIVDEAIELLGGTATGIYPSQGKKTNTNIQQVEVITPSSGIGCFGSRRATQPLPTNASPPLPPPIQFYRALECKPDISYIVPVNSCIDELGDTSSSAIFPVMNLVLLRQLIITKTCRGNDREQKLIDLYKNQMSLFATIGYHAFEVLDDLGYGASSFGLNKKEEEIYRALKQGGKNQHMATPLVKAVIDKVTGTMSFPMTLVSLAGPMLSTVAKN
jgi:GTPase SAR1 family protein